MNHLKRGRQVYKDMTFLMEHFERIAKVVGMWPMNNNDWNGDRINAIYNVIGTRFNVRHSKRFHSLTYTTVAKNLWIRKGKVLGEEQ